MKRKRKRYVLLTKDDVIEPTDEIWDDDWKWQAVAPERSSIVGMKLGDVYNCDDELGDQWRTPPIRRRFDVVGLKKTRVIVWVGSRESSRLYDVDPNKGMSREEALFLTRKAIIEEGERALLGFIGKGPKVLDPLISREELLYLLELHRRLKEKRRSNEQ